MKIYIFGGSFDPPHRGHLEVINRCKDECDLFLLVPSAHSPLKKSIPFASNRHRLEMLNLLIREYGLKAKIETWEIQQGGVSYTFDTVNYLRNRHPDDDLFLIIGADQLDNFTQWKKAEELLKSLHLIVFPREGYGKSTPEGIPFTLISDFKMNISSSLIRENLNSQSIPHELLTPEITKYIQQHHLYGLC